jgi:hypothetical protein
MRRLHEGSGATTGWASLRRADGGREAPSFLDTYKQLLQVNRHAGFKPFQGV